MCMQLDTSIWPLGSEAAAHLLHCAACMMSEACKAQPECSDESVRVHVQAGLQRATATVGFCGDVLTLLVEVDNTALQTRSDEAYAVMPALAFLSWSVAHVQLPAGGGSLRSCQLSGDLDRDAAFQLVVGLCQSTHYHHIRQTDLPAQADLTEARPFLLQRAANAAAPQQQSNAVAPEAPPAEVLAGTVAISDADLANKVPTVWPFVRDFMSAVKGLVALCDVETGVLPCMRYDMSCCCLRCSHAYLLSSSHVR
jgi:hypothetical protein